MRRRESCVMWLWMKALNISWSDKVYNEEVLRRVGEDREIISLSTEDIESGLVIPYVTVVLYH